MTDQQRVTPLRLAAENGVACIYSPPKPAHRLELEEHGVRARGRFAIPKPTEMEIAACEKASRANRDKASAFLFAESFWDIQTVLNWIAHRSRRKLFTCWLYSPRSIRPHYEFLEACRKGVIRGVRDGRLVRRYFWANVTAGMSLADLPIRFEKYAVINAWKEESKPTQSLLHCSKQLCLDEAWRLEDCGQGLRGRPGARELEDWLLKNHPSEQKPDPGSSTYWRILDEFVRKGIRRVPDDRRLSPAKKPCKRRSVDKAFGQS